MSTGARPSTKKETALKAKAYGKKYGLRMWAVYDKAVDMLIETDDELKKEFENANDDE